MNIKMAQQIKAHIDKTTSLSPRPRSPTVEGENQLPMLSSDLYTFADLQAHTHTHTPTPIHQSMANK